MIAGNSRGFRVIKNVREMKKPVEENRDDCS
jgi:hypothetical protein